MEFNITVCQRTTNMFRPLVRNLRFLSRPLKVFYENSLAVNLGPLMVQMCVLCMEPHLNTSNPEIVLAVPYLLDQRISLIFVTHYFKLWSVHST